MTNSEVEAELIKYLIENKYKISESKTNGQTGEDLIATKGDEILIFEIIGYKKSAPARSKDFYEVFFRAISRIDKFTNCKIIIALPFQFSVGMKQRQEHYGKSWYKLGETFPELEIWYIDINSISRHSWNDPLKNK